MTFPGKSTPVPRIGNSGSNGSGGADEDCDGFSEPFILIMRSLAFELIRYGVSPALPLSGQALDYTATAWRILRKLRCFPWRAGQVARAIRVFQSRGNGG